MLALTRPTCGYRWYFPRVLSKAGVQGSLKAYGGSAGDDDWVSGHTLKELPRSGSCRSQWSDWEGIKVYRIREG